MSKKKSVDILNTGTISRIKLSELNPALYNPRVISDAAMGGLKESMSKFGMLNLIVWNKRTKNVVGGHQRLKVLQEQGETETDVLVVELSDKEEMALNVALNNNAIQGDFTAEALEQLKMTEVNLGEYFDKLLLRPISDKLEKKIKRAEKKKSPVDRDGQVEPVFEEKKTEVIIVCPECKSRWRMRDNRVLMNNYKKDIKGQLPHA